MGQKTKTCLFFHNWYYGQIFNCMRWCKKCGSNQFQDPFNMQHPTWKATYNWQAERLVNFIKILIEYS